LRFSLSCNEEGILNHSFFIQFHTFVLTMKTLLHRIFAFFLLVVFMISSSGIVLASHFCHKAAVKEVYLFENTGCCSKKMPCEKPEQPAGVSSHCCFTEYSYHKADIASPTLKMNGKQVPDPAFNSLLQELRIKLTNVSARVIAFDDPPLDEGGKSLLVTLHRFLV
jgi:hypothetical protein